MMTDSDILIIGGGLNGPALALALAQGGLSVTMIDALPLKLLQGDDFDGRAYALALASKRMLSALGIWQEVDADSQPILDIVVSDGKPGEGAAPWTLHFDHAEIEEGPMGHMLEDRYLRRALLAAVEADSRIMAIHGRKVVDQIIHEDRAEVTLDDGAVLSARILVGSDGRDSGTARRAGISRTGWGYDQTGLVCAIAHDKPHHGVAHQFFMPSGPLGILPLPGNRCSIVWAETSERAKWIQSLPDEEYLAELHPRFGDFLGKIALEGKRFAYPLKLTIANSFVSDRLVLVGDAAHGMHPLAGQGLNMGLRDVAALAEVLITAARRGEDISSPLVLERYQQWRRFDVASMAVATDGINRLFSNDNPLLRLGRDLGLGLVNAVPGLRRGLMRNAAGLTGELPRLMQGQPI
ncbi:MAG: FAD-dependent monooxygenase [Paracoccaceae bacterium]|nr:FAD-dependent monooxygenase [Paracoccaceae bacterium]